MTLTLILEQAFNGLQAGVTLFLVAAGLTLILGIMDVVFLAHGAQVMIGAYAAAAITGATGNFYIGLLLAIPLTFASGYLLEFLLIRHLYRRDHMEQVLATFGLILFFNELIRKNEPINAPKFKYNVGINWDSDFGDFALNYRHVDRFDWKDGIWEGVIGPYDIFDLHYNYEINRNLKLSLTAQNIFNDLHKEIIGGAELGRQVIFRLTSSF